MSYADTVTAARRLAILLTLYFAPAYTLARVLLREQVERTGYVVSADKFAAELSWLLDMELIEVLDSQAVRLTERGADVALGKAQMPGVRRPGPGEVGG
jgi:hypothetical protein